MGSPETFRFLETPRGGVTLLPSPAPNARRQGEGTLDFDGVYEAHVQIVARWVARLGGTGVDVEDLTQEVFLVVDRRLHEFRRDSGLATWLFSITAKVVANDRRRRKLRRWWLRLMPNAGEDTAATTDTPLEQLERRERRREFYQVLDGLRERQRRVLVLYELEGLSIAEVAELVGARPGNVRVLLHRARATFLKRMTAGELRDTLTRSRRGEPG
jgi:RNA polymerase sigma-70 factor (ECF subfamily)